MTIIREIATIREYCTIPNNLSFNALKPALHYVEQKYGKKVLGKELYNALLVEINNGSLSANNERLLPYVYRLLSLMAYAQYIALGNVKVSDSGIHAVHTQNEKPAFEWQVKQLRQTMEELAYNAIDEALSFLFANKSEFPLWSNSLEFKEFNQFLIKTAVEFSSYWNINSSFLTFWALKAKMKYVEEFFLEDFLCADFVTSLRQSNVSSSEDLLGWIKNYVARMTIAEGLDELSVEVSVFGVERLYATNIINSSRPADEKERLLLLNRARKEADMYKEKILKFLYTNIDDYALFRNSPCFSEKEIASVKKEPALKKYKSFLRT